MGKAFKQNVFLKIKLTNIFLAEKGAFLKNIGRIVPNIRF